jgi:hypothetical protein
MVAANTAESISRLDMLFLLSQSNELPEGPTPGTSGYAWAASH